MLFIVGLVLVFIYLKYIWNLAMEAKEHLFFYTIQEQQVFNEDEDIYEVYYYDLLKKMFFSLEDAIDYGKTLKRSYIKRMGEEAWLWDNYLPFIVYKDQRYMKDFEDYISALEYAKRHENTTIVLNSLEFPIWHREKEKQKQSVVQLDVPLIQQRPELARGCEVTALTMLLQYKGIDADKLTLAKEIKKDPTPYEKKDGKIYFGNPYEGFVGNIYTYNEPGYGVYNGPIQELLQSYTEKTINLTGAELEDVLYFISEEIPVWVITNTRHKVLPATEFQTWHTPSGPIQVTRRQHAAIITGYDEKYIYINDPLLSYPNHQIEKKVFEQMWKQMGSQAVTYIP